MQLTKTVSGFVRSRKESVLTAETKPLESGFASRGAYSIPDIVVAAFGILQYQLLD
jgi:hypothetical protein